MRPTENPGKISFEDFLNSIVDGLQNSKERIQSGRGKFPAQILEQERDTYAIGNSFLRHLRSKKDLLSTLTLTPHQQRLIEELVFFSYADQLEREGTLLVTIATFLELLAASQQRGLKETAETPYTLEQRLVHGLHRRIPEGVDSQDYNYVFNRMKDLVEGTAFATCSITDEQWAQLSRESAGVHVEDVRTHALTMTFQLLNDLFDTFVVHTPDKQPVEKIALETATKIKKRF